MGRHADNYIIKALPRRSWSDLLNNNLLVLYFHETTRYCGSVIRALDNFSKSIRCFGRSYLKCNKTGDSHNKQRSNHGKQHSDSNTVTALYSRRIFSMKILSPFQYMKSLTVIASYSRIM